jgi:hypothetical protein
MIAVLKDINLKCDYSKPAFLRENCRFRVSQANPKEPSEYSHSYSRIHICRWRVQTVQQATGMMLAGPLSEDSIVLEQHSCLYHTNGNIG